MDLRIGGQPLSTSLIQTTSPDPDANPAGSQAGAWSSGNGETTQTGGRTVGFGLIADGPKGAQPSASDDYLTAMYVQYVDYRGPKRGTVENPFSPGNVRGAQTVPMSRAEGTWVDYRV
ncbi:hypothetical protein [Kineosporia babensis]|uniref:Uncharacterized protein n=1 Tax=Kineosporia babensis TaxID=499548 RepID=A0A9X1ND22_9ACTN|nr:hypothetical protein [Kineosporia babensis]MCD5311609.1 hypothetical protein [Kineosporia babensis]